MAYRLLGVLLISTACLVGCGADGPKDPRCTSGSECVGSGGEGGVGGAGGIGGAETGGAGGSVAAPCETRLLCRVCPVEPSCGTNDDCSVGSVCIESGCNTSSGAPIRQCVFAGGGACNTTDDCPAERECMEVPIEGKRCVKTTPGCSTRFDCVRGFACEGGSCVDRRVPCEFDEDCPKNHICLGTTNSSFCVRIQTDCVEDFNCVGLAPRCADIDGDGNKECAGVFDPNEPSPSACVNSACAEASAPVCEMAEVGSTTVCGRYGLCLDGGDCAPGFECVALWPDGRKECVPTGGACSSSADCAVQEVCAAPREGGVPSCQAGYQE